MNWFRVVCTTHRHGYSPLIPHKNQICGLRSDWSTKWILPSRVQLASLELICILGGYQLIINELLETYITIRSNLVHDLMPLAIFCSVTSIIHIT
jgi:hypothetical protein